MQLPRRPSARGRRLRARRRLPRGWAGRALPDVREVLLNRVVHPLAVPDMGFRALRLVDRFDLVHVHAHPVSLRGLRGAPLVMSEGSSAAVYIGEYLGWDDARLGRGLARSRRMYRALRIADRLLALERATLAPTSSRDWAREINVRWGADAAKLEVIAPGFPTPARGRPRRPRALHGPVRRRRLRAQGRLRARRGDRAAVAGAARAAARAGRLGSRRAQPRPAPARWVPARAGAQGLETIAALRAHGRAASAAVGRHATTLLHEVYRGADAFAMPTHAEGFGFTNVEAMSFGLPVITSTAGPAAEIVDDGRHGAARCARRRRRPARRAACASPVTRPPRGGWATPRARSSCAGSRSSASARTRRVLPASAVRRRDAARADRRLLLPAAGRDRQPARARPCASSPRARLGHRRPRAARGAHTIATRR